MWTRSMDLRSYPFTVEKNTFPRSRIRRANRELRQGRWSLPGYWPVIRRVKAYFRALSFLAASRLGNNEFSKNIRLVGFSDESDAAIFRTRNFYTRKM